MSKKSAVCTIHAPCKINLHLAIGDKRPDGFHELESLFAPLDFHDTLRFEIGGEDGDCSLEMIWEGPPEDIPPEKNLVLRAVSLFREGSGFKSGLRIRLDKRVPVGAGLGGGSSDAASTLLALNSLAGGVLSMGKLREMAAVLGSDVPFFLGGGAAFVGGRGEQVKSVKTPEGLWVLLVKPAFSSDTAEAFWLLDQTRVVSDTFFSPADTLIKALEGDPATWPFCNDFLPVFLDHGAATEAEQYRSILTALKEAGASFCGLSGAGSCCFGIFKVKGTAEKAEKALGIPGNFLKLTFFLARNTIPVLE